MMGLPKSTFVTGTLLLVLKYSNTVLGVDRVDMTSETQIWSQKNGIWSWHSEYGTGTTGYGVGTTECGVGTAECGVGTTGYAVGIPNMGLEQRDMESERGDAAL